MQKSTLPVHRTGVECSVVALDSISQHALLFASCGPAFPPDGDGDGDGDGSDGWCNHCSESSSRCSVATWGKTVAGSVVSRKDPSSSARTVGETISVEKEGLLAEKDGLLVENDGELALALHESSLIVSCDGTATSMRLRRQGCAQTDCGDLPPHAYLCSTISSAGKIVTMNT